MKNRLSSVDINFWSWHLLIFIYSIAGTDNETYMAKVKYKKTNERWSISKYTEYRYRPVYHIRRD